MHARDSAGIKLAVLGPFREIVLGVLGHLWLFWEPPLPPSADTRRPERNPKMCVEAAQED